MRLVIIDAANSTETIDIHAAMEQKLNLRV